MELEWLGSRLIEETSELILVFDREGKILFANRAARDTLRYQSDELLKCNMAQIFRQEFQTEKGETLPFEVEKLAGRDETAMYLKTSACISVAIKLFQAEQENVFFILAENITNQKETGARIRRLKEEEAQNRKARNEFTANITHELRTPVNGIRGHVTNLMNMIEEPEQRKILEIILYCCNNMSAIINNILDFSKLEAGKFTIDEQEFDFYKMMDKVIATHITEINKKELRLSVDVDDKIPQFLIGDELRINQILNNLISNAVKFTSVGYVTIVVNRTRQINDEVELFFMVKDSGIGISEKECDKLFQSFSQVDASVTRRFGGTGLGLSITKQLVELMQGNIHVESEKGKGSTFSFFIKLKTRQNKDENEKQREVFNNWSNFTNEDGEQASGQDSRTEEGANVEELKKRMGKLVLSIEMNAWDKAEMLAGTIKTLTDQKDEAVKKQILRLEMAIRKENHEKSIEVYGQLKKLLEERVGEL